MSIFATVLPAWATWNTQTSPLTKRSYVMEKAVLSENELAQHWGVSPKTLQRWRTEGRGPHYLKLSKRVVYPVVEIRSFESSALYGSTSERARTSDAQPSSRPNLLTAQEAATATGLPIYMFTNKRVRDAAGVPCIHINSSLRFNMHEVLAWARRSSEESEQS